MADKYSTLTQDLLKELFDYKDGILINKKTKKQAGTLHDQRGYRKVMINSVRYFTHKIVFFYHYGYIPKTLDHIDRNPSNNKIENLREVTRSQNQINRNIFKNNKSGFRNVVWNKKDCKWRVNLTINNKQMYFGSYYDIDYAKFIAEAMRYKYFKNLTND
jgi:hypothetical protein